MTLAAVRMDSGWAVMGKGDRTEQMEWTCVFKGLMVKRFFLPNMDQLESPKA